MRILFVHEVQYSTKPIFEMHEFPEALAARGHTVAFADYLEDDLKPTDASRVAPGSYIRFYHLKPKLAGIAGRILAALGGQNFIKRVIFDFRPEIIVLYAVPTLGWQTALVAKRLGIPVVFRALDVSHKIRKTYFSGAIRLAERLTYRRASWISANNPALLDYCRVESRSTDAPGTVDYPPLDLAHFRANAEYVAESRENLAVYMGSLFYFSGLPELLRAMAEIEQPKFRLVIAGSGEQEAEIRREIHTLGLDNIVEMLGFVRFEELPALFQKAKVAINPMIPGLVSNKAFPNKVIQYMAAGIPVVSTPLEGLERTFDKAVLTWADSSADVANQVNNLVVDNDRLNLHSKMGLEAVTGMFDKDKAVLSFESLLNNLVGNNA